MDLLSARAARAVQPMLSYGAAFGQARSDVWDAKDNPDGNIIASVAENKLGTHLLQVDLRARMHARTFTHARTHARTNGHSRMHARTFTHAHTRTRTQVCTHARTRVSSLLNPTGAHKPPATCPCAHTELPKGVACTCSAYY